jgi:urea transport system ATP-binding protein
VLKTLVQEKDITVVIVEQYLNFVREFGHSFYIMNRGAIVAEGPTNALDDNLIATYLNV